MSDSWLALMIGNSRRHWARFVGHQLQATWDTPHHAGSLERQHQQSETNPHFDPNLPIWIASVVPEQNQQWALHANVRFLSLQDIPLKGLYPTLGIDRALAAWGAIQTTGCSVLVIDAGTALTFTGIDCDRTLIGGAILPGLRLQFEALGHRTGALPTVSLSQAKNELPPRWARQTEAAIASGILYTTLAGIQAFIQDWQQQFPDTRVMMTGGDSDRLYHLLQQQRSDLSQRMTLSPHLIFQGMKALRDGN